MQTKIQKKPRFWLFNVFVILFIFTTINREFVLFGLDLRYPTIILGLVLVVLSIFRKPAEDEAATERVRTVFVPLFAFFTWCFISNISWLWNGLTPEPVQAVNQNILLFSNFLALTVFYLYRNFISKHTVNQIIVLSCLVLVFSFVMTLLGFEMADISGSTGARSISVTTSRGEFKNIYGHNFRLAGYAEDANYASVFLVLGAIAALNLVKRKSFKIALVMIFLVALGYASSRTVFFSLAFGLVYQVIFMLIKDNVKYRKILNLVFICVIPAMMILLPRLGLMNNLNTMSTRYMLWGIAEQTFVHSPVIGNGISSARSAINAEHPGWYVQPHSNYWQLLAETGVIGLIIFMFAMYRCLEYGKDDRYAALPIIIMIVFGLTFEIIQLQIFIFVAFLNLMGSHDDEKRPLSS